MTQIKLQKESELVELTPELLMKAYEDAEESIEDNNVCAVTVDLGIVEIKGKQHLLSIHVDSDIGPFYLFVR